MAAPSPEYTTLLSNPHDSMARSMQASTDPALFTTVVHPSAAETPSGKPMYCGKWSWLIALLGCPCVICVGGIDTE
jgi:hypothetical protein